MKIIILFVFYTIFINIIVSIILVILPKKSTFTLTFHLYLQPCALKDVLL